MVMEERSLRTRRVAGSKRRIARRNQRTPESRGVFIAGLFFEVIAKLASDLLSRRPAWVLFVSLRGCPR